MQKVRQQYGLPGIAISGYGMESDVTKSREAGFVDHLVKPVDLSQLHSIIQRIVRLKGAA
jgi:CheY-like chemotaxis protein